MAGTCPAMTGADFVSHKLLAISSFMISFVPA
jgi:hypothetical protein